MRDAELAAEQRVPQQHGGQEHAGGLATQPDWPTRNWVMKPHRTIWTVGQ